MAEITCRIGKKFLMNVFSGLRVEWGSEGVDIKAGIREQGSGNSAERESGGVFPDVDEAGLVDIWAFSRTNPTRRSMLNSRGVGIPFDAGAGFTLHGGLLLH
jgi:hypothetical protein